MIFYPKNPVLDHQRDGGLAFLFLPFGAKIGCIPPRWRCYILDAIQGLPPKGKVGGRVLLLTKSGPQGPALGGHATLM